MRGEGSLASRAVFSPSDTEILMRDCVRFIVRESLGAGSPKATHRAEIPRLAVVARCRSAAEIPIPSGP